MNTEILLFQLLNGVVLSMLLFLIAAGLSLIFGMLNFVNLAHGVFYLLGGYFGLSIATRTGSFWLALFFAPLLIALIGILLETTLLRRLYKRGELNQVLFTFGLALVVADLVLWNWGGYVQTLRVPELLSGFVSLGAINFPIYRLAIIGMGLLIAAVLFLLIGRTKIGAIVRAGVTDPEMVAGLGINVERVFTMVFALGIYLAALSGVAAAPILTLYPDADLDVLLLALVVVVVGGLGSLKGAFWGSLLIGTSDTIGKAVPQLNQFSIFIIFVIMAIVLVVKPTGIFGRSEAA